jgi:ribosomal protein L37AE/L43A
MAQRKLFYAKTKENAVVHIDYVEKALREDLFCPYCQDKVIPKQGEFKIWHFAHSGEPCSHSYDKLEPEMRRLITNSEELSKFSDEINSLSVSQIEVPQDCKEFQCTLCFRVGNKEYGKKWKQNLYICNSCFSDLNGDLPERLPNQF